MLSDRHSALAITGQSWPVDASVSGQDKRAQFQRSPGWVHFIHSPSLPGPYRQEIFQPLVCPLLPALVFKTVLYPPYPETSISALILPLHLDPAGHHGLSDSPLKYLYFRPAFNSKHSHPVLLLWLLWTALTDCHPNLWHPGPPASSNLFLQSKDHALLNFTPHYAIKIFFKKFIWK